MATARRTIGWGDGAVTFERGGDRWVACRGEKKVWITRIKIFDAERFPWVLAKADGQERQFQSLEAAMYAGRESLLEEDAAD
jgi:hypothetical protein